MRLSDGLAAVTLDAPVPGTDAVIDAALRRFELSGVAKTTMDDVARQAKLSRATLYRRYPSKPVLVQAVILTELRRAIAELDATIAGLDDADTRLVEGFVFIVRAMREHRLLQRVLAAEPETILMHLTLSGGPFLAVARAALAERLARAPGPRRSAEELALDAETAVRLLLSLLLTPTTVVDLDDPVAARAYARRLLRPILYGDGDR